MCKIRRDGDGVGEDRGWGLAVDGGERAGGMGDGRGWG